MIRWYAWVENQIYGPYMPEQLGEFVKPDTLICPEGTQEWKSAKDYPELVFLFGGAPVELPPSVGWMVRISGPETILGPYSRNQVSEMIQSGEIDGKDFVKHTDWDDWEPVSATKLVAHKGLVETPAHLPNPEGFHKVVQDATDKDLLKEYNENYKHYARREKKILKEELLKRGLIKKTFGIF